MPNRWTPPPHWPAPPTPDWQPPTGWTPDPAWGPAPEGWNFWPSGPAGQPPAQSSPSRGQGFKGWIVAHKVWSAVIGTFVVLVVIGAIGNAAGSGKSNNSSAPNSATTTTPSSTPTTPPPTVPRTPVGRARQALGDAVSSDLAVGDSKVRSVDRVGPYLEIELTTPSGGFQGPSTEDADALASAAFAESYLSGWKGPATVQFLGGLESKATGKAAPNALAFAYRVGAARARQINWSNEVTLHSIDWGIYRTFCQPAFKGC